MRRQRDRKIREERGDKWEVERKEGKKTEKFSKKVYASMSCQGFLMLYLTTEGDVFT